VQTGGGQRSAFVGSILADRCTATRHKDIFIRLYRNSPVGNPPDVGDLAVARRAKRRPNSTRMRELSMDGIRAGEIAIELPKTFDASLYFIGRLRTPWKRREDCPKNAREARETNAICTIE